MSIDDKKRRAMREVAVTFLSFWGKEKLSTQGNLFEHLQRFERRCVVDNNIAWWELSGLPENNNTAFILGTTMDHETAKLRSLWLNADGSPRVRRNVFHFGMRSSSARDLAYSHSHMMLVITRLDPLFGDLMDMPRFEKFEAHRAAGQTPRDTSWSIANERKEILAILKLKQLDVDAKFSPTEIDALQARIDGQLGQCFKDFWKSNDVVRLVHAKLLTCSKRARGEFLEPNYPNVFGDAHLLLNALFLNAGILSKDTGVKKMALSCRIKCFERLK